MNATRFHGGCWTLTVLFAVATLVSAQEPKSADLPKSIQLPTPRMEGGKPLMQALKDRKSARSFSTQPLPPQVLANLLWAAFGINRPGSNGRTAPSAMNRQEIDVYVATAEGLFLYDAKANSLQLVLAGDVRAATGRQGFAKEAPVNLIYVANYAKMGQTSADDKTLYASVATGCISQNVYLFCASEGLATVVRAMVDKPALAKTMKLGADQKIILAQTVGYPKE